MIETRRLKNIVTFIQTILSFVLSRKNKNITIQKADKGNSVVIINRMIYIVKMEELLSDRSKFTKVEFNSKY